MTCLTGAGAVVLEPGDACDPTPFLRTRKSRKFMGLQDDLAVVAAGRALESAGLTKLGERAGLFLAVGYIPFSEVDIAPVLAASMNEGRFDVRRFGAGGYQQAHPLLTFRCLPNMPAYHVSACFDVQGPYFVTYPGPSELYAALEEARHALASGLVDVALVGGVAAQSNFLVRHHFARIEPPVPAAALRDAAAVLVLESEGRARARGAAVRATLASLEIAYQPPSLDAYTTPPAPRAAHTLGPAALAIALAGELERGIPGSFRHDLNGRDGIRASSTWVLS